MFHKIMNKRALQTRNIRILLVVLFTFILSPYLSMAEDSTTENRNRIHLLPHGIGIPIRNILLVKSGSEIYAIRFTSIDRGHDKKEPSIWSSGEESEYAEYDWYCLKGEPLNFSEGSVRSGHKKLYYKAPKGIGRFAFQTGNTYIKCCSVKLLWTYPTYVYFPEYGGKQKEGMKVLFAPTTYQNIDAVDLNKNHAWYGYDETRQRKFIDLKLLK